MVEEKGRQLGESESINESNTISGAERCLLRKCDRRILPILFCLMTLAFISMQDLSQEPNHRR